LIFAKEKYYILGKTVLFLLKIISVWCIEKDVDPPVIHPGITDDALPWRWLYRGVFLITELSNSEAGSFSSGVSEWKLRGFFIV
jgi:hypothetical protein